MKICDYNPLRIINSVGHSGRSVLSLLKETVLKNNNLGQSTKCNYTVSTRIFMFRHDIDVAAIDYCIAYSNFDNIEQVCATFVKFNDLFSRYGGVGWPDSYSIDADIEYFTNQVIFANNALCSEYGLMSTSTLVDNKYYKYRRFINADALG
jgi:hypothetical protein